MKKELFNYCFHFEAISIYVCPILKLLPCRQINTKTRFETNVKGDLDTKVGIGTQIRGTPTKSRQFYNLKIWSVACR